MEISVFDREIDITKHLTNKMTEAYEAVSDKIGMHSTQREWENAGVTRVDQALRIRFWEYLNKCVDRGHKMSVKTLVDGFVTRKNFYEILDNPTRCAYLFTKPSNFLVETKILLDKAAQRLEKILDLPIYDDKGRPSGAVINAQIKAYSLLADRAHGKSIERIQQHQMIESKKTEVPKSMKEIEKELRSLEGTETIAIEAEIIEPQDSHTKEQ